MTGLSTRILDDPAAIAGLEAEWWDLWHADINASPFQSPAWLLPWVAEFATGRLAWVTVRRAGTLVGLVPFISDPAAPGIALCGGGISDYLDGIFAPDPTGGAAAAAALEAIADAAPRIDRMSLANLRPGSRLWSAPPPHDWRDDGAGDPQPCPAIELAGATALADVVPRRILKNFEYARRRARRDHRFEIVSATADNAIDQFAVLADLHARRWAERDLPGVFEDAAVARFHRAAVPRLAAAGILRLPVLFIDGRPVAALYSVVAKGCWQYYISGFDPALGRLSLGTILVGEAIEQALAEGCESFDFLRGSEPYKYAWGASDRQIATRTVRRLQAPRP